MIEIILTLLVSAVFILFAVFIIVLLSKNTTRNIAEKTIHLVSIYDDLLSEKSIELEKAKAELDEVEKQIKNCSKGMGQGSVYQAHNGRKIQKRSQISAIPSFLSDNFCDTYNAIRDNFEIDINSVVKKHSEIAQIKNVENNGLANLLEEIPFETFYDMSFLQEEEQIGIINEKFPPELKRYFAEYCENENSFNALDFYTYLCDIRDKEEQYATIRVASTVKIPKNFEFDVHVDESICEGVQIEINHKLYDYSINKKEIDSYVNNK